MDRTEEAQTGNGEMKISCSDLLAMLPYGKQFLFIDEFVEAERSNIVARYRLRKDQFFYADHFLDRPITPGVILLEAMCQCGMVAQGLYLLAHETGIENARRHRFLFTGAEVEWFAQVHPGELVIMRSQLLAWRQRRVRARVKMFNQVGSLVAESTVSGIGVSWEPQLVPNVPHERANEKFMGISDTK